MNASDFCPERDCDGPQDNWSEACWDGFFDHQEQEWLNTRDERY